MAFTAKVKGTKITVALGDGATPTEVFTVICGMSEKGLTRTKQINETTDWDCADANALPVTVKDVNGSSWSINMSGLFHATSRPNIDAFYALTTSRNVRVVFDDGANIDGYYQGKAHMSSLEIGATNGQYGTASITLEGDGELTWTNTP
ncbi:MAG: phage tail tube protein [Shewanella sp.]